MFLLGFESGEGLFWTKIGRLRRRSKTPKISAPAAGLSFTDTNYSILTMICSDEDLGTSERNFVSTSLAPQGHSEAIL